MHRDEEVGQSINSGTSKQTTFSRKPRRTTGGQTCSWPGCKRLFRHRNIYEEHQRMHERGIPGKQGLLYFYYVNNSNHFMRAAVEMSRGRILSSHMYKTAVHVF